MKTHYNIGQLVWYVECYRYNRGKSKDPVVWYRPMRARINHIQVDHWEPWDRKGKNKISVKYKVEFANENLNNKYQQQNINIFANKENAWEYAKLTNAIVRLYPLPEAKRIPLTVKLHTKQKEVRNREPIECPFWI